MLREIYHPVEMILLRPMGLWIRKTMITATAVVLAPPAQGDKVVWVGFAFPLPQVQLPMAFPAPMVLIAHQGHAAAARPLYV